MKIRQVIVTKRALADADEAFVWLFNEEPEAADRWYEELLVAIRSLARSPQRCGLAREDPFFEQEIRQLIYNRNYRIIFTIRDATVVVLRVRHGARQTLRSLHDE